MSSAEDLITRMVYIIRAKDELISALKEDLDIEGIKILSRPSVIMSEERPYELYFESWHNLIYRTVKEEYLAWEFEFGELSRVELREIVGIDVGTPDKSEIFDRWWQIERAKDYVELTPWYEQDCEAYVVRAKQTLVASLKHILDPEGEELLARSYVVTVHGQSPEQYVDIWFKSIIKAWQGQHLHGLYESGELSFDEISNIIAINEINDNKQEVFSRWWLLERAEGCWEIESSWLKAQL